MTEHLTLMPKTRLIQRLRAAEAAARYWQGRHAALTPTLSFDAPPAEIRTAAQAMLDALPSDPMAGRHRAALIEALDGPPDTRDCGRSLDAQGRWRARRAERGAA